MTSAPGAVRAQGLGRFIPADWRASGWTLSALGLLLLAGIVLRALVVIAWRPGFLGYPDSSVYLEAAQGPTWNPAIPNSVFFDRIRAAGYPIFLRMLHPFSHDIAFPIVVQHLLGLATAVLLFLCVRRIGGPRWLGLVPAGVVLLGGTEVFAEHAAITEALYIFLLAAAIYSALRALDSRDFGWAVLAGCLIGAATGVRFLGLLLIPVFAVWFALAGPDTLRGKLLNVAAFVAGAVVLVGTYVIAQKQAVDYTGLSRHGWGIYGRVAGFADCDKFKPPAGTQVLCESTPRSQRQGPDFYIYGRSPAVLAFGYGDWGGDRLSTPEDERKIRAFTRAVVLNQPLDYAEAVSRDVFAFFFPSSYYYKGKEGAGLMPGQFVDDLTQPSNSDFVMRDVLPGYYSSSGYTTHRELLDRLETYERVTRIHGVVALLALIGPFLSRGRLRAGISLFTVIVVVSLVAPAAAAGYDARYGIPVFGLLTAAATLGAYAIWRFARPRLAPRAARSGAPGRTS